LERFIGRGIVRKKAEGFNYSMGAPAQNPGEERRPQQHNRGQGGQNRHGQSQRPGQSGPRHNGGGARQESSGRRRWGR